MSLYHWLGAEAESADVISAVVLAGVVSMAADWCQEGFRTAGPPNEVCVSWGNEIHPREDVLSEMIRFHTCSGPPRPRDIHTYIIPKGENH